jgi:hypothetical protein
VRRRIKGKKEKIFENFSPLPLESETIHHKGLSQKI